MANVAGAHTLRGIDESPALDLLVLQPGGLLEGDAPVVAVDVENEVDVGVSEDDLLDVRADGAHLQGAGLPCGAQIEGSPLVGMEHPVHDGVVRASGCDLELHEPGATLEGGLIHGGLVDVEGRQKGATAERLGADAGDRIGELDRGEIDAIAEERTRNGRSVDGRRCRVERVYRTCGG